MCSNELVMSRLLCVFKSPLTPNPKYFSLDVLTESCVNGGQSTNLINLLFLPLEYLLGEITQWRFHIFYCMMDDLSLVFNKLVPTKVMDDHFITSFQNVFLVFLISHQWNWILRVQFSILTPLLDLVCSSSTLEDSQH